VGPVSFSIESYGQSETAQTSAKAQQDPAVLLRYLDQFTNITDLGTQEEEVRDQLLSNQTEIEKAQSPVSRIPEFKKLRVWGYSSHSGTYQSFPRYLRTSSSWEAPFQA